MVFVSLKEATLILKQGGVIAYPTEAVFGFGADPMNEAAVSTILKIKARPVEKGVILIASHLSQLQPYIEELPLSHQNEILASWPGPNTWVLPKSKACPSWISGAHETVAVRVSNHPIVCELCDLFGGALVSTSANRSQEPPLRDSQAVLEQFYSELDGVIDALVGIELAPSTIRDGRTGRVMRS